MSEDEGKYVPPLEGRRSKLRLDFNENTVGCSPAVLEVLKNLSREDLATYPEYGTLRKTLADSLGIPKERLITTNGADEAIRLVSFYALGRGGKVVIPDPSFAMWKVDAQQFGADIADVPYNSDLSFPATGVLDSIDDETKLVVVVTPNNPTGSSINRRDLISILKKAENAVVAVDEAYYEFSGETFLDLVDEYPNLAVIRTFSKAYGMAGLRLGYLVAQGGLASELDRLNSPYGVNNLAVIAALAGLEDRAYVLDYAAEVKRNRKYLIEELQSLGLETFRTDANFVLVRLGGKKDYVIEALGERGILVRDMGRYPIIADCLRITIGTKEQMKLFVSELKDILGGMAE